MISKSNLLRLWGVSSLVILLACKETQRNPELLLTSHTEHQAPKYKVYLTFDDGPLNGSQNISAVIQKEKIPVTVLLVGEHAEVRPEDVSLYRNNPFITIGNHSYSHANGHYKAYYSEPEHVLQDFQKNKALLKLNTTIGRLPGRNMWRIGNRSRNDVSSGVAAADLLHQHGYTLFGWDLEWRHDPHTAEPIGSAKEQLDRLQELLEKNEVFHENHVVLLCHDEMFQNGYEASELKQLIDLIRAHPDYQLANLEAYP